MKLTIVIPVFNEKYTFEQVFHEVRTAPLPEGLDREIIVVDDGSTDGTCERVRRLGASFPETRVIAQDRNRGKGAALRAGIEQASGDFILFQDADLEYDPRDYEKLLRPLLQGEADAVYGSRFAASEQRRVLFFWHSVGNRFLTMLSNLFTDLNLTDMETCYKVVRTELLKSIPLRSDRFGIEPEITAKLAKRGCRIFEVPISYRGRTYQEGKKITWRDGIKAIVVILRYGLVDDLYNERYGHDILHSLSKTHRFNAWMADAIQPWVGDEVLEIGAGMGNLTRQFLPRTKYVASDIDRLHLDYLEALYDRNDRVTVTAANLAHPDDFIALEEQFDTVICLNVIEHIEDDLGALRCLARTLKPGGRACILVPQGAWLMGSLDNVLGHCRRYSRKELEQRLKEAGLEVERVRDFNHVSVPAWYVNGRLLKRKAFGRVQLKVFDSLVWLWKRIDRFFPWRGISLIAIARKGTAPPAN